MRCAIGSLAERSRSQNALPAETETDEVVVDEDVRKERRISGLVSTCRCGAPLARIDPLIHLDARR